MVDQSKEDISDCRNGFDIGFMLSGNLSVTPVHKGHRGGNTGTSFGTKIAISAQKCISTRDNENVITYNRGFSWSANPKKTFLI